MKNRIFLLEAGTGLGKTLGYLAPASTWARKNSGTAWISTYTKNLQRQLERETKRLFLNASEHRKKVVIRKGRENYICLLNLQEYFGNLNTNNPKQVLLAALIARWTHSSRDGDMIGGDFPAWLLNLFDDPASGGRGGGQRALRSLGLTDRQGECIYSSCPHYRKCFIEKARNASWEADIVIANHALIMTQAALDSAFGGPETSEEQEEQNTSDTVRRIYRLVLDEGHHLFDVADGVFAKHLTALESSQLRRWLKGPEGPGRRGRSFGDRLGDLADDNMEKDAELIDEIVNCANALPGPGWKNRIANNTSVGEAEAFFTLVRTQVQVRTRIHESAYNLEADCRPPVPGLLKSAAELKTALEKLLRPMKVLAASLIARLSDDAAKLDTSDRARIDSIARSLSRYAVLTLTPWINMLAQLELDAADDFVDWFAVEPGRAPKGFLNDSMSDVGMHSHWLDPTIPFSKQVLEQIDGVLITSATLKDYPPDLPDDWRNAEMRTGALHLPTPAGRRAYASPFNYPEQTRIIVVTDVNREKPDQVASAYRELFLAAGGGALGLFTAISRLREIHARLAGPLADQGITLFAQHVDPADTGMLVDLFRAEHNSCLLGTDAMRDGIDIPGDALRLIVLDRVPWPRADILERARKKAFGGSAWTDMQVRLKLRQAFGRLIRKQNDRGVFVILDPRFASRFKTAFPPGLDTTRLGLVDAIEATSEFLSDDVEASSPDR